MFASGQLPKFADNLYHDAVEDYWMVPTAEVPLTGMLMASGVNEQQLSIIDTMHSLLPAEKCRRQGCARHQAWSPV